MSTRYGMPLHRPMALEGDEMVDEHELFFQFVELLLSDPIITDDTVGKLVRGWVAERRKKD